MTRYGALIEAMDTSIGRVLDELDRLLNFATRRLSSLLQTTAATAVLRTTDRPLRAAKGHLYEGGIRVPLIVRWPGHAKAESTCDEPVVGTDLFATLLDSCSLELNKPSDGIVPLLHGAPQLDRDAIYFHYPNYAWHKSNRLGAAIRSRRYKLIQRFDDQSVELFDLESDLGETKNLASDMPKQAAQLTERLQQWLISTKAAMPTPRDVAERK